jgi:hypothetical protein
MTEPTDPAASPEPPRETPERIEPANAVQALLEFALSTPMPAGPIEPSPAADPIATPSAVPAVESTRRLLGASFDLLGRASDDMRRASFYIGMIVLVTVAPAVLATWALEVAALHHTESGLERVMGQAGYSWYGILVWVAFVGLAVAVIESRNMAASILGGRLAGRPVTTRQALQRSRMVYWRAVVGWLIVGIPVAMAQGILTVVAETLFGPQTDLSIVITTLAAALAGAPLAYILTGIVLGDVGAFEATRRSFRVFRARKMAAVIVAVFETAAVLLVVLGLSAGLDLGLRLFDALGVGPDSGPAGLAFVSVGIVVLVFAFGTLLYTAFAISIAPQVVMFVGLTQATIGLDHVRPGGRRDAAAPVAGQRRFRWLTLPMLAALAFQVAALAIVLARLAG